MPFIRRLTTLERHKAILRIKQLKNKMLNIVYHSGDYGNILDLLSYSYQHKYKTTLRKLRNIPHYSKNIIRLQKILKKIRRKAMLSFIDYNFQNSLSMLNSDENKEYKQLIRKIGI